MKIPSDPNLPASNSPGYIGLLNVRLADLFRRIAAQLNALSEGQIAASYNALPSPPAAGNFNEGDQIRNSTPAESGDTGAMYVVIGWIYIGGEWKEMRVLTGN